MHNPFEENIRKMQEEQAALNEIASSRGSVVMSHRSSVKSITSHHGHTKSQISGTLANSTLDKQAEASIDMFITPTGSPNKNGHHKRANTMIPLKNTITCDQEEEEEQNAAHST